jgi:hypothetical protein
VYVSIVFEGVDQIANRAFVEKVRPRGIKIRWLENAGTTAVVTAGSGKRDAAEGAERS